jgi:hypothetical protein
MERYLNSYPRLAPVANSCLARQARGMADRYEIKPKTSGCWTVYTTTALPAAVNGTILRGLCLEDADDLVDLLNRLHVEQLTSTSR